MPQWRQNIPGDATKIQYSQNKLINYKIKWSTGQKLRQSPEHNTEKPQGVDITPITDSFWAQLSTTIPNDCGILPP